MPVIPPHLREQIRSANDIVEVINSYVPLRRSGGSFVALCPFHREKTPSFHVSPSRQAFHCFGCSKGGDVFRFVQDYENISFMEAARRLADRAGIRLELQETKGQREERAIQDQLRELHEQITQRWQQVLTTDAAGQRAREYLETRGVSEEAMRIFRLGCAPDGWDDTVHWARSKGWDVSLMEQSGLIVARDPQDPSRGHYDRFRGRLMFPIADEQGRIIGFSGRILQADEKSAKYVNSPESPIFTKSRVLYGLDKTKRSILDAGSAIICEGQLDLIACFMAGVKNVVAPQGTALTAEHLRILRRYAQEAVLCFDSDSAGKKAAARVLDDLLASGLAIRVIGLPAPHDPDSYIKANGAEVFRQLAAGARDFFEFYLEFLCSQHNVATDRGRLAVVEAMAVAVGKTDNAVLLDRYAQRTAMMLAAAGGVAISPDAVRTEFRKRLGRPTRTNAARPVDTAPASPPPKAAPVEPLPPQEFWLLKLLFLNDEFCGWLGLHLDPDWICHSGVARLVRRRLEMHADGTWQSPAAFLGEIEDDDLRSLASSSMADHREIPNQEQQLRDVVRQLRNAAIDRRRQVLLARIDMPSMPPDEKTALQREINQLRMLKAAPLVARVPAAES